GRHTGPGTSAPSPTHPRRHDDPARPCRDRTSPPPPHLAGRSATPAKRSAPQPLAVNAPPGRSATVNPDVDRSDGPDEGTVGPSSGRAWAAVVTGCTRRVSGHRGHSTDGRYGPAQALLAVQHPADHLGPPLPVTDL